MKRRRRRTPTDEKTDRWVVSYADFITLLFAFFATLYGISSVDVKKLTEFTASLREAFKQEEVVTAGVLTQNQVQVIPEVMNEVAAGIQGIFNGVSDVEVRTEERGVVVTLGESLFFAPGSAELRDSAIKTLSELALFLKGIDNNVLIEGHTDNIPIKGSKENNWLLSAHRAYSVFRVFVENFGLSPERFMIAGYGPYKPVRENSTPEGRAKNRRVDIVILR